MHNNIENDGIKAFLLWAVALSLIIGSNTTLASHAKIDSLNDLLTKEYSDSNIVNLNLKLGRQWEGINFDSSIYYYNCALNIANKNNWLDEKAKVFINIGFAYQFVLQSEESIVYLKKGLDVYKSNKNVKGQLDTYYNLGTFYGHFEKYHHAIEYFILAEKIGLALKDSVRLGMVYNNLGLMYYYTGQFDKANVYQYNALRIKKLRSDKTISLTHINIGKNYLQQSKFKESIEHFYMALNSFKSSNSKYYLAITFNNIADAYREMNHIDSALQHYNNAFELFVELKDSNSMANYYKAIGNINILRGELNLAERNLDKALKVLPEKSNLSKFSDAGGLRIRFQTHLYIANLQFKKVEHLNINTKELFNKALQSGNEMLSIANHVGSNKMKSESFNVLYRANKGLGNIKSSLINATKLLQVNDSLYTEEKQKVIVDIQTKYETEKKEQQIARQQDEIEYQMLVLKQERLIRNSFIGGFVFTLLLLVIIFRNLMQKKKSNIILAEQKEEIMAQSDKLKSSNEMLVELSHFKEDMTNMLVHDLKTPLSAIINVDLISDEKDWKSLIKQSGYKMLHLVQNMLDVYKYENSEFNLNKANIHLTELVKTTINEVHFLAERKQLVFINELNPNCEIIADKEILQRVFANIFSNAVKFSPQKGIIRIFTRYNNQNNIQIVISNQGPNIPKTKQKQIFEKFGQAKAKGDGRIASTGLGLTFCKMAIEAHGGEIGVVSEEGNAVEFWFCIPDFKRGQLSNAIPEEVLNFAEILSAKEKQYLKPFALKLIKLEIYEVTAINFIMNSVELKTPSIDKWIKALEEVIFNCDEKAYKVLINSCM